MRTVLRNRAIPPMVGREERPLSLTTMTSERELSSLMLLSASQVIPPPVRAPSPTTATTCRSSCPVISKAREMPSAQDSELDACDDSTMSCSLSGALRVAGEPAAAPEPREVLRGR